MPRVRAAAPALAAVLLAAAPSANAGGRGCAPTTLDCGDAPPRMCLAFVEGLSDAGSRGIRLSGEAGAGEHLRLAETRVFAIGMAGRLVRKAPGGPERATPALEMAIMDHPDGVPDSAYRDFADALLRAETAPMRR